MTELDIAPARASAESDGLDFVVVERLEHPSIRARAIQVLHSARALAEHGHRATVHLRPLEPAAKGHQALSLWLAASFSMDGPETFEARPLAAIRPRLAGLELRGKLLSALASADERKVFYARDRRLALALARARRWIGRRARLVYELHELEHRTAAALGDTAAAAHLRREEDRLFRLVDGIVCVSAPLAADLRTQHSPSCPVAVIGGGVDLERFADVGQPDLDRDPLRAMYAGSLARQAGVDALIAAVRELEGRVELTIVGGQPASEMVRLRSRLTENGTLAARVHFVGQVPPRAVPGWLAKADLLLLPAGADPRASRWASPLKLFEAMATRIPIVAAPCDAHLDLLVDGETAFFAAQADGAGYAEAIRRVLGDRAAALDVARRARKLAERHDWGERARRIEGFVREIGGKPAPSRRARPSRS